MKRLLLIEDEEVIVKALRRLLERNHYTVQTAGTVEQALAAEPQTFDLILADLRLPGAEGTAIIPAAEPVPVVIMTSHASVRSAVDAMRHGAIDYIAKPFDHDELLMVIQRALVQNLLQAQNRALRLDVRRTQPLQRHVEGTVLETLLKEFNNMKIAQRCLHLHGEQGTDREGLARVIHANSERSDAPFVVADVGARSAAEDAIALLGESGQAPADGLPPGGLLQAAQNGTLVLRHPEALPTDLQLQLAKALSSGTVVLPDTARHRLIDVKVISIALDSIEHLLKSGKLVPELAGLFLNDQFEVPPLRQRPDDILPLAYQQLQALERRNGLKPLKLTAEAVAVLRANDWPGNVAELDSVMTRAVFVAHGQNITVGDIGFGRTSSGARDLSLDEYFRFFVLSNQASLSETELAARMGISRKALWERRQKMSLPRDINDELSS